MGTARCWTVIEVVPQMKACAPKTKKIARATAGSVVSASPRCVRVSTTRPMRIRSPRLTRRVIQPYDAVPISPPTAPTVVMSPKPTACRPSRSVA